MRIDTFISHEYIDEQVLKDKSIVVIDTLRATSVMVTAMDNGALSLSIVKEPSDALKLRDENGNLTLGGERMGLKIDGFDLSNSPLEYTEEKVSGKDIVMTTSNGTKTMMKIGPSKDIIIAAMINAKAAAEKLKALDKDAVIVDAGTYGKLSFEDFITGGSIINNLINMGMDLDLCDTSLSSLICYKDDKLHGSCETLKKSLHYGRLEKLGFTEDLEYCLKESIIDCVPVMRDYKIKLEK